MKKNHQIIEVSIIFFGHLKVVKLAYRTILFPQVHCKVLAVWYCSHYLPPLSLTLVANLLLVLLTLMANLSPALWHQGYLGQNLPRCHWYWWCTMTCKYLRKFEKIQNVPNVIFRGLGEDDSWRKPKAKISWHYPLIMSVAEFSCSLLIKVRVYSNIKDCKAACCWCLVCSKWRFFGQW
jgi:hypothetical protein